MFRLLLSSQYHNLSDLVNYQLNMLRLNFIDIGMTSTDHAGHPKFDIHKCINTIGSGVNNKIQLNCPTMFDVEHIESSVSGRQSIYDMLLALHQATHWGTQAGFTKSYRSGAQVMKDVLTPEQINNIITFPYINDRFGNPSPLDLSQFIVCWAHPYTDNREIWENLLRNSIQQVQQYHRPVYADITHAYHNECKLKELRGKLVEPDELIWMIQKAYEYRYSGVILRPNTQITIEPNSKHYEAITNVMNQIIEQ